MHKSAPVMAIAITAVLALAACSDPTGAADQGSTRGAPAVADVAAASGAGVVSQAGISDTDRRLITAQAIGTVRGTPDVVTITLGVETTSASAQTALDDNNRLAADAIAIVKANGVAPEDLQTSQLSVNPTYDDSRQITGYQVANLVTATLRDITTAGALIDAVGKAVGDAVRVQQLAFSIDDDSALRAAARADAVKRAQAQAQQMADAAGVQLGPIHAITEVPGSSPVYYGQAPAAGAEAASVPIEPGSQELSVVVQVVYEIA